MKHILILAIVMSVPFLAAEGKKWPGTAPVEVSLTQIQELPKGCSEESAFGLIFEFNGYSFEGLLYPLHDCRWIVLSYWCMDEDETIYIIDKETGDTVPASSRFKDPFKGMKYPVITTDSVSFITRNYSHQTVNLYSKPKGNKVWGEVDFECILNVLDADPKTRRVYCRTDPGDWMWGEPETEEEKEWKHPYVSVIGWVDEEWICASLMSTCP